MSHNKLLHFSIFDISKPNFSKNDLRFILLYHSPNCSVTLFFNRLREIVRSELHIDTILDDFNLNMFNDSSDSLKSILSSYELGINKTTHVSGLLIDHEIVPVSDINFSDHDVVKFKISST